MGEQKVSQRPESLRAIGFFFVRLTSRAVDLAVMLGLLFLFGIGVYGIWDAQQVYRAADVTKFEIYKPTLQETTSFAALSRLNDEVIGWLTVYGTGIDYPLVQGEDNIKYLTTDASGAFAPSGSLYLDYRNQADFTDFNSIIFGHHMAQSAMFGDVSRFADAAYFDAHQYGMLYAANRSYGLEFWVMLDVDAYDKAIYRPALEEEARAEYLALISAKAVCIRDVPVTPEDHLVLFSTCAEDVTNGRHVLVAKLLEDVPENPYPTEAPSTPRGGRKRTLGTAVRRVPTLVWSLGILFILLFLQVMLRKRRGSEAPMSRGETTR